MKVKNEYQKAFPNYDLTPKAVIAALAYSLAMRLSSDDIEEAEAILKDEWITLYHAKIVPQKPRN